MSTQLSRFRDSILEVVLKWGIAEELAPSVRDWLRLISD